MFDGVLWWEEGGKGVARGRVEEAGGANLIVFVSKGGGTRGTRLLCDCSVRGGQPLLVEERDEGEAAGNNDSREQETGDRELPEKRPRRNRCTPSRNY